MEMPPGTVPVFTTALADLIVYIALAFHVLRFRYGAIDSLDVPGPDERFGYIPFLALGGREQAARLDRRGL